MNKLFLLFLGIIFSTESFAQLYQSDLGFPKLDKQFHIADSLRRINNFKEAYTQYQIVFEGYSASSNLEEKEIFQNAYYSKLRAFYCQHKFGGNKEALKGIKSIKSKVVSKLGKEHKASVYLYELLAKCSSDLKEQSIYFEKVLKIREKILPENDSNLAWAYDNLGRVLLKMNKPEESLDLRKKALSIRKKFTEPDTLQLIAAYNNLSATHYKLYRIQEVINHLDSAYQLAKEFLPRDHQYTHQLAYNLSISYLEMGEYDKSIASAKESIQLKKLSDDSLHVYNTLIGPYLTLSSTFNLTGKPLESMQYLDSVEMILGKLDEPRISDEILFRIRKSNIISNLSERIELLEEALRITKEYEFGNVNDEIAILNNLSAAYGKLGDSKSRILYLEKARKLLINEAPENHESLIINYVNTIFYYESINQRQTSLELIEIAEQKLKGIQFPDNDYDAALKLKKIKINLDLNNINRARKDLLILEKEFQKRYVQENFLAELYFLKAQVAYDVEQYQEALRGLDKSLDIIDQNYFSFKINDRIKLVEFKVKILKAAGHDDTKREFIKEEIESCGILIDENSLQFDLDSIKNRIYAFDVLDLYNNEIEEEISYPLFAELLDLKLQLIELQEKYYFFSNSENEFLNQVRPFYENSISKLYSFLQKNQSADIQESLVNLIFHFRNLKLKSGFEDYELQKIDNIELKNLYLCYDRVLEKIELAKTQKRFNEEFESLKNELFELEEKRIELTSSVPKLIDDSPKLNPYQELIKSSNNRGIILYHIDEHHVYVIYFCDEEVQIDVLDKVKVFTKWASLSDHLNNWESLHRESGFDDRFQEFIELNQTLSKELLPADLCGHKKLSIFPVEFLSNFPFDLLFSKELGDEFDYASLPYLLKEKVISCHHEIDEIKSKNNEKFTPDYFGFAPEYLGQNKNIRSNLLSALKYNVREVETAKEMFNGVSFLKEKSTKKNFIENADEASILHLALHGSYDDQIKMESYLNFTTDTLSESKMFAYEISLLDLKADLTVLSSCEANKGVSENGLGFTGLSRAFQLAGCKNLITTSWVIDDWASDHIVSKFFEGVQQDIPYADALREAKLNYISNASRIKAHPAHWAAFNYYGYNYHPKREPWKYFVLLIPLILILGLIFLKKN